MVGISSLTDYDYDLFRKNKGNGQISKKIGGKRLLLSAMPFPHEEIAVLANIDFGKVSSFCDKKGFYCHKINDSQILVKRTAFKPEEKRGVLFSGYVFINGKLIFGRDDFFGNSNSHERIDCEYGEYALFRTSGSKIELLSDYFGMVSIFYYQCDKRFAATNSYHFLLDLLVACGEKLEINLLQSQVNLICTGFHLGGAFTKDMDVKNIKITYPYEKVIFDCETNSIDIVRTDFFDILNSEEEWDEDVYEDYLNKGLEELESNVRSIFEKEQFKRIVIDLSAGYDSRVVFGVADNLPKRLRNKISVYSRNTHTGDDYELAQLIRSMFGDKRYFYVNTDSEQIVREDGLNLAQISRNLGSFGNHTDVKRSVLDVVDQVEIMGGLGEVILGYKRGSGRANCKDVSEELFLDRLGRQYYSRKVSQLKSIFDGKLQILKSTFGDFSCDCLFKKLHVLYAISRNRFHFGSSRNIFHNNPHVLPLQSKYLLKAKWMYFNKFHDNNIPDEKLSLDLIYKINPILSMVPFSRENDAGLSEKNNLLHPIFGRNFEYIEELIDDTPPIISAKDDGKEKYIKHVQDWLSNIEIAKYMLDKICVFSKEYEHICTALYKLLLQFQSEEKCNTGACHNVVRKINDLYFQILCITNSKE